MWKKSIVLLVVILCFIGAYHLVKQDKKTINTSVATPITDTIIDTRISVEKAKTQAKTPVPLNYWVHFDPKTASQSLSAYGEFFNVNTDKALYLTSVENKDFERVELHTVKDGKDTVIGTDTDTDKALILPPMGGSVKLEYGGNYILLIAPKKPIIDNSETILTLHYRTEGSDEELIQNLVFSITANGIGCGAIPPSE